MNKLPAKLGGYEEYDYIKTAIGKAVYDSLTITDFEGSWMRMLERYNIADNEWLKGLYDNRHRWVPAFVKDCFWAGMSTTQLSESMHAFFDGYVNVKTTLKHFASQYENVLRDKVEKEVIAYFNSFHSTIPCITNFDIENQFQSVYTNSKFKEVQEELTHIMYCDRSFIQKEGAIETYKIIEDVLIDKDQGWIKDYVYRVYFNVEEFEVKCSCRRFEFGGIICRNIFCVLTHKKIKEVPSHYILDRWRKNGKRKYNFIPYTYGGMEDPPIAKRFDSLCIFFLPIAEMGAMSDDSCNALFEQLHTLKIEPSSKSTSENNNEQLGTHEAAPTNGEGTSKTILSPIVVRCAGRPPSLIKESKVDKLIRQAREKKKKAEQREKKKVEQKEKKKTQQHVRSTNMKNKRSSTKRKSLENDVLQPHEMEHEESFESGVAYGNINPTSYGTVEGSFNLGISTGDTNPTMTGAVPYIAIQNSFDFGNTNINPTMDASLPSASSSAMVMPPVLGTYTSMLLQVQQSSAALSNSAELHFDGAGRLSDTMDQS